MAGNAGIGASFAVECNEGFLDGVANLARGGTDGPVRPLSPVEAKELPRSAREERLELSVRAGIRARDELGDLRGSVEWSAGWPEFRGRGVGGGCVELAVVVADGRLAVGVEEGRRGIVGD